MSLFGASAAKPGGFGFGSSTTTTTQPQSSLFGGSTTAQPQQSQTTGGGLFGSSAINNNTMQQPQSTGLFGGAAQSQPQQQQQQPTGLFGSSTAQNQQPSSGLFGGSTQQQQSQPNTGLFGSSTQQQSQSNTGLFGGSIQQQSQPNTGLFGGSTQQQSQPTAGLFGAPAQQPQQQNNPFGLSSQQQQQQQLQQSQQQQQQQQRPFDQTLRFGQSQPQQSNPQGQPQDVMRQSGLWEEGRGMGVYRSVPAQMMIVKDKWDPASLSSPLRTYLYQHVGDEAEAFKYRPGPGEDESKWESAVQRRPGPAWVPLVVRGFFELGKKAQIQMEAIAKCNMMLQEINTSLDIQLDTHRTKVAARLAETKRRHAAISQRTLALAVKVQILRNRGYVMDNAEEELKAKLAVLERGVFDPALQAREQEVWARMLGIRERAKILKSEMERLAPQGGEGGEETPLLDDETTKAAKKTLDAYDTQLRHLQKEMLLVQEEFSDWETTASGHGGGDVNVDHHRSRRR